MGLNPKTDMFGMVSLHNSAWICTAALLSTNRQQQHSSESKPTRPRRCVADDVCSRECVTCFWQVHVCSRWPTAPHTRCRCSPLTCRHGNERFISRAAAAAQPCDRNKSHFKPTHYVSNLSVSPDRLTHTQTHTPPIITLQRSEACFCSVVVSNTSERLVQQFLPPPASQHFPHTLTSPRLGSSWTQRATLTAVT